MKKYIFLIFALMIIPSSFAFSTKDLCDNLQQVTLNLGDKGNLTEFPDEILEIVNQQISQDVSLSDSLSEIDNIEFRAEIYYNSSLCFSGSFMFNDSKLEFFKLFSESEEGEVISFKLELYTMDSIISDWVGMNDQELEPLEYVKLILSSIAKMIGGILNGDIIIKPFFGIFKVFKVIFVFARLNFINIGQNIGNLVA